MYIFTKAFTSATSFLHFGLFGEESETLFANAYGNVDSNSRREYWSMQSASITKILQEKKFRQWTDAKHIANGVVSLVARLSGGSETSLAQHIGMKISQHPDGKMTNELLWISKQDDGNSDFKLVK